MAERGILFKPEMVRARLSGVKTMTRRTRGLEVLNRDPGAWTYHGTDDEGAHVFHGPEKLSIRCPYGVPGDVLWWKEAWVRGAFDRGGDMVTLYRADGEDSRVARWHSSILMPRWASRIVVPLVAVRAERVTDISDTDAVAEGVDEWNGGEVSRAPGVPRACFRGLWDEINAAKGLPFDMGPWCWVLTMGEVRR